MKGKLQFYDYVQLECEPESLTSSWVPTEEETGKVRKHNDVDPEFAFVRERPDTHKLFSVLSSVFCCLPVGLLALYLSMQVKRLYEDGDIQGAHRSSHISLRLNHSACILGVIFWTIGLYCALMFLAHE